LCQAAVDTICPAIEINPSVAGSRHNAEKGKFTLSVMNKSEAISLSFFLSFLLFGHNIAPFKVFFFY
jgi:hypothetical protein